MPRPPAGDVFGDSRSVTRGARTAESALSKPFGSVLGLDLKCGGHLSHGASANVSGKV